jgi:hypothetical protein
MKTSETSRSIVAPHVQFKLDNVSLSGKCFQDHTRRRQDQHEKDRKDIKNKLRISYPKIPIRHMLHQDIRP